MDLVYGNDGMNYRTFARSGNINMRVEQLLLKNYRKYYFPDNASAYSKPENVPESIIYVSSDLNRALPKNHIILAKNGRMRTFTTPSSYLHAHLIEADDNYYKNEFFDIFSIVFLDDLQAEKATDEFMDTYQPTIQDDVSGEALTCEQVKAILYCLFSYERRNRPVKILLDNDSGDVYNRRSREVLKTIYRYLPYDFRKRYGFVSYMDEKQPSVARVGFELYDRTQVKRINLMDVDLADCDSERMRQRVARKQICDYADRLVEMSESERKEEFDLLEVLSEGGRINLQSCVEYQEHIDSWKNGSVKALLPVWIDYVYDNFMQQGPLYKQLIKTIGKNIGKNIDENNIIYNEYLMEVIRKENADFLNMPESVRHILLFADYVPVLIMNEGECEERYLELDDDQLIDWDNKKHPNHITKKLTLEQVTEKCNQLKEEISIIEQLDLSVKSFDSVKEQMIDNRQMTLMEWEEARKRIQEERIKNGKTEIDRLFTTVESELSVKYVRRVINNAESFKDIPELKEYYCKKYEDWIIPLINEKVDSKKSTELDIMLVEACLNEAASLLNPATVEKYKKKIGVRHAEIIEEKERRQPATYHVEKRTDLIDLIKAIGLEEKIQQEHPDEGEREAVINIGRFSESMKVSEINDVCEFLVAPNNDNLQLFWDICVKYGQNDIILWLVRNRLFTKDHLEYLSNVFLNKKYIHDSDIRTEIDVYINNMVRYGTPAVKLPTIRSEKQAVSRPSKRGENDAGSKEVTDQRTRGNTGVSGTANPSESDSENPKNFFNKLGKRFGL